MNDEFLHALRRDPPPEFARELQRRLQRQSAQRSTRFRTVRTLLAVFLIGGVAMAAALLLRNRDEPPRVDAPIAQTAAPQTPARATQPAVTPRPNRQVTGIPASQPQAIEPQAKDIPLALVTTSLARPLAQALVEQVNKSGKYAQPRLLALDVDEAFRSLCGNVDFVVLSRRISDSELAQCHKWGIGLAEWKLGYQAVVLAAAPTTALLALSPREVFLALARRIPDPAEPSRLIDNPNTTWHDVDARFAYRSIEILMPPHATTRAALLQLVLEPGCETYPWIRSLRGLDRPLYDDVCHQLRGDGRIREVELSNTLVTQKLWAQPNGLVVLDYSYYASYRKELSTMLEGAAPTLATLADGTYTAARPVYVYAQARQMYGSPAARMLLNELTSDHAVGPWGYLPRQGLVPLDETARRQQREEFAR
ncbi:MAG: substrate-binding domain-containing protein [Steroidobacteraceae bacterium]